MKRVLSIGLLLSVIISIAPVSAMDFTPSEMEATRLAGSVVEQIQEVVAQDVVAPTWKEAVVSRAQGFVASATQTGSTVLTQGKNLVASSKESLKTRGSEVVAKGSALVRQGATAVAAKGSALYTQGSAFVRQGATSALATGSAVYARGKNLVSQAGTYLSTQGNRLVELAQPSLNRSKELLGAARDYAVTNSTKAVELVKQNPKMAAALGLGAATVTGLTIYGIKKYNDAQKRARTVDLTGLFVQENKRKTIAIDETSLDLDNAIIVDNK